MPSKLYGSKCCAFILETEHGFLDHTREHQRRKYTLLSHRSSLSVSLLLSFVSCKNLTFYCIVGTLTGTEQHYLLTFAECMPIVCQNRPVGRLRPES